MEGIYKLTAFFSANSSYQVIVRNPVFTNNGNTLSAIKIATTFSGKFHNDEPKEIVLSACPIRLEKLYYEELVELKNLVD